MVNGSRSSHSAKDEENNYRRVTRSSEKGNIKSHSNVSDKTGVRRSPRETSLKKIIPGPSSSTRKSGRLENRTPPAPANKRKAERVEIKMPSPFTPLTRSGRTRSQSSSCYSDSKSSGSLSSNSKPKKEKSVKQLIFEAKEVIENEEHDLGAPQIEVQRMTAHIYRSFFQLPEEEPNRIDNSNQGANNGGGKIDECSKESHCVCEEISKNNVLPSEDGNSKEMRVDTGLSGPVNDLVENTITLGSLAPSNAVRPSEDGKSKEIRVDIRLSGPMKDPVENTMTLGSLATSNVVLPSKDGKSKEARVDNGLSVAVKDTVENTMTQGSLATSNVVLPSKDGKSKETGADNGLSVAVKDMVENTMTQGPLATSNVVLPSKDGKSKETRVDNGLSVAVKDTVENTIILGSSAPSYAATYETGLAPESIHPDYCKEETLQMLVSSNSLLDEDLIRNNVGDDRGENLIPFKSKEITVVDSDVSAMLVKNDNCNLILDASSPSRLGGNIMGTDCPSDATINETGLLLERVQPDCCREETLPSSSSKNDVLSSEDGKSKERRVDSGLSVPVKDLVANTVTLGSLAPSDETGLAPESIQPDYQREKRNSILDDSVGHDSSGKILVPSKRKGIMVDMDSDVSGMLPKDDNCSLVPDSSSPSQLGGNVMGTDGSCSKRIRLDYNPSLSESCIPSATEVQDGDYIDASMPQKDSQIANEKEPGLITNSNTSVTQLKERSSSHIGYRCKSDSFRFVEYWVPVQISNLQLEQYCSILLSNASILRSSSRVDSVEAVRDVLISTRKCCSHPYLVGPDLQPSLNKGLEPIEYLDFDLKASGKLQLLDSMLEELRKKDLRVLILFQSIGGSGRVIGNYLEDLLRPRFGSDSYERIDKSLLPSKKQAAMKKFNDKNNKRFVFLLETCACLPSIKLSSVDSIIIFDSDWNPMNDIRSLQKITIDSQFELIKIFRLYSSFTVEEKALILSKQCKIFDINLPNWSIFHMLLIWGASCLFDELEVFHNGETSASNVKSLFGRPLLKEAMHEFSSLLCQDGEHIDSNNCSTLLKVQQNGATYHANSSLFGELKFRVLDEEPPQLFWTKLLEGKQFQWKYLNSSSQRIRKKVHHFDGSASGLVNEGATKKRRKVSNNIVEQRSSKSEDEKFSTGIKAGTSGDLLDRTPGNNAESEQKSTQHDEQRSLHLLLKPDIRKLCDVLLLPDNVKRMIDNFLEYVMNNHNVNREPFSILQAFQLSLCWTAASFLKHKLGPIASLIQDLNFDCKKEEVDHVCSMLSCLKKIFLYRTGNYHDTGLPKACEPSNRAYSCTGVAREVELFKKDMSKSIKEIQKKCEKKLKKLHLLQDEEKQRLRAAIEEEKAKFEERYKIRSAVIRSCSPNDVTRMEKLRVLNIEYEKGIEELKFHHDSWLKDLEDKQLAEIQKFQDKEAAWLEDVKSWAHNEYLNVVTSKELRTGVEPLQTCDQLLPDNGLKNNLAEGKGHDDRVEAGTVTVTESSPDKRISNRATVSLLDGEELLGQHGIVNIIDCPLNGTAVNEISDRELRLSNVPDNNTLLSPRNQNSGVPSSILDGRIPVEVQKTSNEVDTVCVLKREVPVETPTMVNIIDCSQKASSLNPPSSGHLVSDKGPLYVPGSDRVLSPRACQASSLSDGPTTISISNPLLEQQTTDRVALSIPAAIDCPDDIEHLTNAVSGDKRITSDQQRVHKTMTELSQGTPVSRTVNVTDPPEQVQHLSVESSPDHDTSEEMLCSSDQPELVSSAVDAAAPADQSNHVSLIVKPVEQVQQLTSVELASSHLDSAIFPLTTEVEHQPSVVPNQDAQLHSTLELDSHSYEDAVHPASYSDSNTVTPSEVRVQSADTINLLNPLEINYQFMQAENRSASRMLHLSNDPLKNELDNIQKASEQTIKNYEDTKLRLKTDFEKELEELRRKYDIKFKGIEVEFKQRKTTLDTGLKVVHMNKCLADAFRSKCSSIRPSCSSGMPPDSSLAGQHLLQPSRQQSASRPPPVAGSSTTSTATASSNPPLIVTSIRAGYSASRFSPNVSARSPIINTISLPVGNPQAGAQIRAPAPHLQPYRP